MDKKRLKVALLVLDAVNPIQDGGEQKGPPTRFSSVTSANVEISPQNFQTFSVNSSSTLL